MVTDYQKIQQAIERALDVGRQKFIIYPYGEYGMLTKILNESFGVQESYIVDNKLSKFNPHIKNLEYFKDRGLSELSFYTVLFNSANPDVREDVCNSLKAYFPADCIVDIFKDSEKEKKDSEQCHTICGKYSYGPLCDHWLVYSVGSFSSFAAGCDVVQNHAVGYLSTHPFLYADREVNPVFQCKYDEYSDAKWYFPGAKPQAAINNLRRVTIGSDVWFGKNVTITNGANIGNGVIAGAGAVITKDVPDYAVVAGVPARIIRYRYTQEQIRRLNVVAWWNWPDDVIRERYDDFYLKIEAFIHKYG